jgi:hypothetical protein
MDWKDVGKAVGKAVPLLGTVLGGPVGAAAGGVVSVVCQALGIENDNAAPEKVIQAIRQDPQGVLVKLKEIESAERITLRKMALDEDHMYLTDRQSARSADVEKTKATGSRDINLYVLSWVVIAGFFVLVGILIFKQIPDSNQTAKVALPMLFGALISGFKDVLGYFFGSSKGSSDKTALLAKK